MLNVGKLLVSFRQQVLTNLEKSNANTGNVTNSPENSTDFEDYSAGRSKPLPYG